MKTNRRVKMTINIKDDFQELKMIHKMKTSSELKTTQNNEEDIKKMKMIKTSPNIKMTSIIYLGQSRTMWDYMGRSGTIWDYLCLK